MTCPLCKDSKDGEMLCGYLDPPPSKARLIGRRMTFRMCPQAGVSTITGVVTGSDYNSVMIGERYIRDRHVISMEDAPPRWWTALAFVFDVMMSIRTKTTSARCAASRCCAGG